jgi:hypothetical protein
MVIAIWVIVETKAQIREPPSARTIVTKGMTEMDMKFS